MTTPWRVRAKMGVLVLVALLAMMRQDVFAEDHLLKFQRKIGVSAAEGWSRWMSFVAFSPDGTMVASDGPVTPHDRTEELTIWSFPDGRLLKHFPLRSWVIAANWQYLASDRSVFQLQKGTSLTPLRKTKGGRAVLGFSADGQYVVTTNRTTYRSGAKKIRVERTADGALVSESGSRAVSPLAFHPDATLLASGHWDNVPLWNVRTGERIALLQGFGRYVSGISFSRNGTVLAAGTDFGGLQIWDVASRTLLHALDLQGGVVSTPAFSPDGSLVAVGVYGTGSVFVVDVATGAIRDRARVSGLGCGSVAFSPDGRYLITPSTGGLITWPYDRAGTIRVFEIGPSDSTPR